MKKTNYLLSAFFLSAMLTVAACGQKIDRTTPLESNNNSSVVPAQTATLVKETVEGKEFALKNDAGKCQLIYAGETFDLQIPTPCDFHRSPEKAVRVFPRDFYSGKKKQPKNYKNTPIFLIESSTANPDRPNDCRTQLQAVKIVSGKARVSKLVSKLAACPPFQWEEANFTGLFE